MIKFLTLFLGLVAGVQTVEVTVSSEVGAVEIWLDGARCGRVDGPPWSVPCHFGADLLPHELVAVAFDAAGKELGRDRQWLNFSRAQAEANLILEASQTSATGARFARVVWSSVTGKPPTLLVTLDGRPVEVKEDRFALPPDDNPDVVHLLEAELIFEFGISARAVLAYGGRFGSAVSAELTAMPWELPPASSLETLQGRFLHRGTPLPVVALDAEGEDLLVVRQSGSFRPLVNSSVGRRLVPAIGRDGWVNFIAPYLHEMRQADGKTVHLFPSSDWRAARHQGEHWLRQRVGLREEHRRELRLADAVAVAGSTAMSRNRRRAVLVLLEEPGEDLSVHRPEVVRRYLEALGVPLVVWDLSGPNKEVPPGWGEAMVVRTVGDYQRALDQLEKLFQRQTVVWFEGGVLPQQVTATAQGPPLGRVPAPAVR